MGTKERRERERSDLRQRILDAALTIISTEGFAALSMRKLAERVEYSAAAIYLHFENREQIAQALSEAGFQTMLDALETTGRGKTGVEALHALGATYVAFGLQHPEIYQLIFMGDSDYMAAAFAANQTDNAPARAYGALLTVAQQLKDAGVAPADLDLTTIAELIWATLHGIVSLRITCAAFQVTAPETLATLATQTIAHGLKLRA